MLCAKFGFNWPSGSVVEDIKFCQCIFAISLLSSFGKDRVLHLYKREFPILNDALCLVWLKLA